MAYACTTLKFIKLPACSNVNRAGIYSNNKPVTSNTTVMITSLTPMLLGYLIRQGYKYCLAKSEIKDDEIAVMLTPTKRKPVLSFMHRNYDYYCTITAEPLHMALDKTAPANRVSIQLSTQELKDYQSSLAVH